MRRNSTQIAMGGVFSALCLLFMFLTGVIPLASYAMPALAGAMLAAVVIENGARTALLAYVAVSALSLFVVPDREAAVMFIALFGYYPIAKCKLERLCRPVMEYALKLALFNGAVIAGYAALAFIFGIPLFDGGASLGRYSVPVLLIFGNAVFAVYDYALTKCITFYVKWFRPRFLRR